MHMKISHQKKDSSFQNHNSGLGELPESPFVVVVTKNDFFS